MLRLVFDLETNGLLHQPWAWSPAERENPPPILSTIHCMCVSNLDDPHGYVSRFHDDSTIPASGTLEEGLVYLERADVLIGQNIINYDLPVLLEQRGWEPKPNQVIRDTLVLSRMGYTSLLAKDKRINKAALPKSMWGKHSLRSWGYRLNFHKGHVNDTENWEVFDEDMLDYCARDVDLTCRLYQLFDVWAGPIEDAVAIEHAFFTALGDMQRIGWHLDLGAAWLLVDKLLVAKEELEKGLLDLFPARVVPATHINTDEGRVPNPSAEAPNAYWNPKGLKTKEKIYPFKPGSAMQVIWNLNRKYDWVPSKVTAKGNPEFGESIIAELPFPECKDLVRYAQVTARLAELIGKRGYLTLVGDDGRLHGRINHCGAVTHRCTHSHPNMGNVTGVTNRSGVPQLFGREMRALFTVPDDSYCIVGADASGLELRMLGHRMAEYDDGDYACEVVEGDAHARNAEVMRLSKHHPRHEGESDKAWSARKRINSKPIIYAHNYGAANLRLGRALEPEGAGWNEAKAKRLGGQLRKNLLAGLPALGKLIDGLKSGWREGSTITGLDGRLAENRAAYQALNTQLQMDGAVVIKWATTFVTRSATKRWGKPAADGNWCMVGHVHDEYQFQVKKEIADEFGQLAVDAIGEAGRCLSVVCRLDGEFKVGRSWADTH